MRASAKYCPTGVFQLQVVLTPAAMVPPGFTADVRS
jgi:hypothetical protein